MALSQRNSYIFLMSIAFSVLIIAPLIVGHSCCQQYSILTTASLTPLFRYVR